MSASPPTRRERYREGGAAGAVWVDPAQHGELFAGPVVTHPHIVRDRLDARLPPVQLELLAVDQVQVVVGELAAGVRRPVWRVGLQVGGFLRRGPTGRPRRARSAR